MTQQVVLFLPLSPSSRENWDPSFADVPEWLEVRLTAESMLALRRLGNIADAYAGIRYITASYDEHAEWGPSAESRLCSPCAVVSSKHLGSTVRFHSEHKDDADDMETIAISLDEMEKRLQGAEAQWAGDTDELPSEAAWKKLVSQHPALAHTAQDEMAAFIGALTRVALVDGADVDALTTQLAKRLSVLAAIHQSLKAKEINAGTLTAGETAELLRTELEIRQCARRATGIKEVRFFDDARGTTVGLVLTSGESNSLTGTWKVPIA